MAQPIITISKIFLLMAASAIVPISCGVIKNDSLSSGQIMEDVISLDQAIFNNDRKQIIDIFIRKYRDNRFSLVNAYNKRFREGLTVNFQQGITHDFANLMAVLAIDPLDYNVIEIFRTWDGFYDLDYSAFPEILPFHNITSIIAKYRSIYRYVMSLELRELTHPGVTRSEKLLSYLSKGYTEGFPKDQSQYYADLLPVQINNPRHFTRLIVLSLNDGILDRVKESYEQSHLESIENLLNRISEKYYREAVLAIFNI
ncbi:uncharacterized protein LOC130672882 [Microplitis mediator]|uniref:uncharacterized protein LOC130672882 n=1 Tax=Microplitis mediator TaxID=375433 RepID=UPI0025566BDE|nr:uncharacterized protein LOC130672882 [Microplitis mediator]